MWLSETKLALHIRRVKCHVKPNLPDSEKSRKSFRPSRLHMPRSEICFESTETTANAKSRLRVRAGRSLKTWNFINAQMVVDRSKQRHSCSRRSLSLKFIELICIPATASASLALQAINEEKVFSTVQQIWQAITDCSKLCAHTKDSHIDSLLAYESAHTRLTVVCTALGFRRQKFSNDIERQTFLIKYLTLGTGLRRSGRR